jgi:hypothetical protein
VAVREIESYLRVTAPFSGMVTERGVHPGALVGPGSGGRAAPLLRLAWVRPGSSGTTGRIESPLALENRHVPIVRSPIRFVLAASSLRGA